MVNLGLNGLRGTKTYGTGVAKGLKEVDGEIVECIHSGSVQEELHDTADEDSESDLRAEGFFDHGHKSSSGGDIFFVFLLSLKVGQLHLHVGMRFGKTTNP